MFYFCSKCGTKSENNATVCHKCGNALDGVADLACAAAQDAEQGGPSGQQRIRDNRDTVGSAVAALVKLLFVSAIWFAASPLVASVGFFVAMLLQISGKVLGRTLASYLVFPLSLVIIALFPLLFIDAYRKAVSGLLVRALDFYGLDSMSVG